MDLYQRQQRREERRERDKERLNKGRQEQRRGVGVQSNQIYLGFFTERDLLQIAFLTKQAGRERKPEKDRLRDGEDGQMRSGERGVFLPW